MGLHFVFLLLACIACQIQFNSGSPPLTDAQKALLEKWVGPPFNEIEYEDALKQRNYFQSTRGGWTAKQVAKPEEKVELPDIEVLPQVTAEQLFEIFLFIRDTKFVKDVEGFERTLNWRYPNGGCESRAELATRAIFQKNLTIPKKVFVFGSPLRVGTQTADDKNALMQWNYHVALIYRVERVPYVLDPALDYNSPLRLSEWNLALFKNSEDLKYSICAPTTIVESDACYQCLVRPQHEVLEIQIPLLAKEESLLETLGRNSKTELRKGPPFV